MRCLKLFRHANRKPACHRTVTVFGVDGILNNDRNAEAESRSGSILAGEAPLINQSD